MTTDALTENEERFVQEFMVDRDPVSAALRTGVAKINIKRTVGKWMSDPRILRAIQAATDKMPIEDMITPQRIVAGFMAVAFDPLAPSAAKNSALRELASLRKMYDDPDENANRSGVMMVPLSASLEDWAMAALQAQTKLKEEVKK